MKLGPKPKPEAERFWPKVQRTSLFDCWPWTGSRTRNGYGNFKGSMGHEGTHRTAYRLTHGPIPDGLCVCHTCDNKPCCNPSHLFLGTKKDNWNDMVAKRRGAIGELNSLAKLTEAQVLSARARRAAGETFRAIARDLGVDPSTICAATSGRSWRHLTG